MMGNKFALLIALFCLWATPALSHPLNLAYLQVVIQGSEKIEATLDVHPDVAKQISNVTDKIEAQALFDKSLGGSQISFTGAMCEWDSSSLKLIEKETIVTLSAEAKCISTGGNVAVSLPFLKDREESYELLGRVIHGDDEQFFRLTPKETTLTLEPKANPHFGGLIEMGIDHIGASPSEWRSPEGMYHFPEGIDHILFLVALILGATSLTGIILTAGGFTIGHSITLALALLNVIHLPSRFVETLIAASIALVAVEALYLKASLKFRIIVATFFGLIHGMGFATALSVLNLSGFWNKVLSLVGFNVGIELGQLIIIIILCPFVFWLNKKPVYVKYFKPVAAFGLFMAGGIWFVERAFDISIF